TALGNLGGSVALAVAAASGAGALVVDGAPLAESRRRCAHCGALGPSMIRVCFACGEPQLELASGPMSVFITGPGEHAHKLDAALRKRLLDWIAANPALGVDPKVLAKEFPRVPFALVCGIDDESARALEPCLRELGLETEVLEGGRFAHRGVRRKGWTLARRIAVIGGTGSLYAFHRSAGMAIGGAVFIALASLVSGFHQAGRPAVKRVAGDARPALPSAFDAALAR